MDVIDWFLNLSGEQLIAITLILIAIALIVFWIWVYLIEREIKQIKKQIKESLNATVSSETGA